MDSQQYMTMEDQYNAHNYKPLDVVLTRGEGVWLEDVEGKRFFFGKKETPPPGPGQT